MFTQTDRDKCEKLYRKYYDGRKFHDTLYRERICKYLSPGAWVLDAGCGRYLRFSKELPDTARVFGIDLDTVMETDNASAPYGVRGDLGRLPFPSGRFDLVISRSVVEHLEDPARVFREFGRVLKPGGHVVVITPNKYDYVSIIAALTPYRVHRRLVSRIFDVPGEDVFPTLYRANTPSAIQKAFRAAGFVAREIDSINHYPAYLMFSPVLFRLGVVYERITSLKPFGALRGSLLCVFQKPAEAAPQSAEPAKARPLAEERIGVA